LENCDRIIETTTFSASSGNGDVEMSAQHCFALGWLKESDEFTSGSSVGPE